MRAKSVLDGSSAPSDDWCLPLPNEDQLSRLANPDHEKLPHPLLRRPSESLSSEEDTSDPVLLCLLARGTSGPRPLNRTSVVGNAKSRILTDNDRCGSVVVCCGSAEKVSNLTSWLSLERRFGFEEEGMRAISDPDEVDRCERAVDVRREIAGEGGAGLDDTSVESRVVVDAKVLRGSLVFLSVIVSLCSC